MSDPHYVAGTDGRRLLYGGFSPKVERLVAELKILNGGPLRYAELSRQSTYRMKQKLQRFLDWSIDKDLIVRHPGWLERPNNWSARRWSAYKRRGTGAGVTYYILTEKGRTVMGLLA